MIDIMHRWVKERDKAVKTMDIQKFKAFYYKWKRLGIYQMDLPEDNVIEISMRKMILAMASATEKEKEAARQWLLERGYSDEI